MKLVRDGRRGYSLWYAGASLLLFSSLWALRTWVGLTMDELVYHLSSNLEGTGGGMIQKFIVNCLIPAIVVGVVVYFIFFILYRKNITAKTKAERSKKERIIRIIIWWIPWFIILYAAVHFNNGVGFIDYVKGQVQGSTFVEDNYVDPNSVEITFPEEKRNLVYVYLESMEMTYSDTASGGAFDEDVIPQLTQLGLENECFAGDTGVLNGGYCLPGATWTMGAMMGQTSALPLQLSVKHNAMSSQDSFFNDLTTLGDILEEQGYHQVFMLGSKATFGGRDTYFTQHGNYDIMDYNYAVENGWIDEDYYVFWGFEDEILFEHAKEELTTLGQESMENGTPFNFTILTVDTHFEDGYVCDRCQDLFGEQMANVMYCSSEQVGELVDWIQQQEWYDNTTVILSGDHLTMDSNFCANVDSDYNRRTYVSIINAEANNAEEATGDEVVSKSSSTEARQYSTFDLFPTTLAAMNVKIEGDKLGLGTNLFSDTKTLIEEYGLDYLNTELAKSSSFIAEMADIDMDAVKDANATEDIIYMDIQLVDYDLDTGKGKILFTNVTGATENTVGFQINYYPNKHDSECQTLDMTYDSDLGGYVADIDLSEYKYGTSKFVTYAIGGSQKNWETTDISPIIYMDLVFMDYNANQDSQYIQITGSGKYTRRLQTWISDQITSYGYDPENLDSIKYSKIQKLFKLNHAGINVKIYDSETDELLTDITFGTNDFPMKVYD